MKITKAAAGLPPVDDIVFCFPPVDDIVFCFPPVDDIVYCLLFSSCGYCFCLLFILYPARALRALGLLLTVGWGNWTENRFEAKTAATPRAPLT